MNGWSDPPCLGLVGLAQVAEGALNLDNHLKRGLDGLEDPIRFRLQSTVTFRPPGSARPTE